MSAEHKPHSTQQLVETVRVALDYFEPGDRYADQHEYIVNAHAALSSLVEQLEALREPFLVSRIVFSEVERLINADEPQAAKETLREFQLAIDASFREGPFVLSNPATDDGAYWRAQGGVPSPATEAGIEVATRLGGASPPASVPASSPVASTDGYVECACGCRNSVTKGCAWRRCDRCSAVLDPSDVSYQDSGPSKP